MFKLRIIVYGTKHSSFYSYFIYTVLNVIFTN